MSASNPLYQFQEYLKSINIEGAWNELKAKNPSIEFGSSDIIIGIIDQDGIESENISSKEEAVVSDLKGSVDGKEKFSCFYNFATNTFAIGHNDYRNSAHGTQVAGIISANNNSEGISGIAPNCRLFAINTRTSSPSTTTIEQSRKKYDDQRLKEIVK